MRAVLQRVARSEVTVEGKTVGKIEKGLLVLLGVQKGDTQEECILMADKIARLRIFEDEAGKMNRSLLDVGGAVLAVSQFTLFADCAKGRRPSFLEAARPEEAIPLYEQFQTCLREEGILVETGQFGADMQVTLENDGPVTIYLDTREWSRPDAKG